MNDPTPEINTAVDAAREAERQERDQAIDDEVAQTDRIAEARGGNVSEPAE